MAAPTYTWTYQENLFGFGPPKIVTLGASTDLETKVGTALIMYQGNVDEATATVVALIGLACEATTAAATAGDAVKVQILRQGDVIKGTSNADASAASGFYRKLYDFGTDGRLDYADNSGGCLSILRTEDSGLTVYCVPTISALF
jgi:hypothetical protein